MPTVDSSDDVIAIQSRLEPVVEIIRIKVVAVSKRLEVVRTNPNLTPAHVGTFEEAIFAVVPEGSIALPSVGETSIVDL